jgi:hypothetical protein
MRQPVFRYQEERDTDAPMSVFRSRLADPGALASLRACPGLHPLEADGDELVLRWRHARLGSVEDGTLRVSPREDGARLQLTGRLKGWGAFLVLGMVRWRTDRLLDHLVREL